MKYLITGASGFIGTHLCEFFNANQVSYRTFGRTKKNNEADGHVTPNLLLFQNWSALFKDITVVIHLAAKVHDMSCPSKKEYIQTNVEITKKVAEEAKKNGVRRFIFLSTIKVNGEYTLDSPFTPEDQPNPQDPYAISKLAAETELFKLHEPGIFEIVIIRPPLVYGHGVKANFQSLVSLVRWHIPLPFGAIKNRRSLISIYNLVDLISTCAIHPDAIGEIFLVSDGADISLTDLIRLIGQALGVHTVLIPIPPALLNIAARVANRPQYITRLFANLHVNIDKTLTLLNWKPPFTIQESLKRMVATHDS